MLTKYLTLFYNHLKWVLDSLLFYPFYKLHDSQQPISFRADLKTFHYEFPSCSEEHVDCAVCLHKIGDGQEVIRMLRCEHVFHEGCLDRLVGFKSATCPLCKGSVGPTGPLTHSGAEVLLLQFCAQKPNRDTWWLR